MHRHIFAIALVSLLLAACNDGGSSASSAPALRMSVSPHVLHFSWNDPVRARVYRLQTSIDGGLTYSEGTYIGEPSDDSTFNGAMGFSPHIYDPAKVMFRLQSCLDAVCVTSAPVTLGANVAGLVEVINSERPLADSEFGGRVAISGIGQTLAISDPGADVPRTGLTHDCDAEVPVNCIPRAGAVYVYEQFLEGWYLTATVTASNAGNLDRFGEMLALSGDGNTLVVGAFGEDGMTDGTASSPVTDDGCDGLAPAAPCLADSGAVYVFARSGFGWTQQAYLKAARPHAGDHFGDEVAISLDASLLVVGAMREDGGGSGVNPDSLLDCEAALPGNCAIDSGAVYLFRAGTDGLWQQESYLKALAGAAPATGFGNFVAVSGNGRTVAVTRTNPDGASNAAYVYTDFGGGWEPDGLITNSEPDNAIFIPALDYNGNLLVLGSPQFANTGSVVFVSHGNDGRWNRFQEVFAPHARAGLAFGSTVAVNADGTLVAIGAPLDSSSGSGFNINFLSCQPDDLPRCAPGSGTVHLFAPVDGEWQLVRSVKSLSTEAVADISTTVADTASADLFGAFVAMSIYGDRLVVTAPFDDSGHAGTHGDTRDGCELLPVSNCARNSGSVLIY